MERILIGLIALSAMFLLLTTYLAVFYVPLVQTGVGSANDVLASLEGSDLCVAGFVAIVYEKNPNETIFALGDFVDFQRWCAHRNGTGSSIWWTAAPLDISASNEFETISIGKNISVRGTVVQSIVGNFSAQTGYSLSVASSENVEIGVSPGQFELMSAPIAQKIFYFHMPAAWLSYLAFFVALVASFLFLKKHDLKYDRLAFCSVELGILFATIAIATGPIWAKEEWGVYWRWDDSKLITTFILWLAYIGYLSLRSAISEPFSRARMAAVYGILAFVTVPMSFLASRIEPLLSSSHPQVIATSSGGLSMEAAVTVIVAIIAFTLLFITMLLLRVDVASKHEKIEEMKRLIGGED